jgi:thioredoxin-related protein
MKKAFLICLSTIAIFASHVNWLGNYNKALDLAKKSKKPLLVLLIKNDCNRCKEVVKNVFTNSTYVEKINRSYVAVIVNYDNLDYPSELYYTTSFPALYLVNSSNEIFIGSTCYYKDFKNLECKLLK